MMERREFFGVGAGALVAGATGSFEYLTPLNVANVKAVCDKMLPETNKCQPSEGDPSKVEDYASLVETLHRYEIKSLGALVDLVRDHLSIALVKDKQLANPRKKCQQFTSSERKQMVIRKRKQRGVFLLHVGLVRECLWQTAIYKEKLRLASKEIA